MSWYIKPRRKLRLSVSGMDVIEGAD